jgi:hypothetical protein
MAHEGDFQIVAQSELSAPLAYIAFQLTIQIAGGKKQR